MFQFKCITFCNWFQFFFSFPVGDVPKGMSQNFDDIPYPKYENSEWKYETIEQSLLCRGPCPILIACINANKRETRKKTGSLYRESNREPVSFLVSLLHHSVTLYIEHHDAVLDYAIAIQISMDIYSRQTLLQASCILNT